MEHAFSVGDQDCIILMFCMHLVFASVADRYHKQVTKQVVHNGILYVFGPTEMTLLTEGTVHPDPSIVPVSINGLMLCNQECHCCSA